LTGAAGRSGVLVAVGYLKRISDVRTPPMNTDALAEIDLCAARRMNQQGGFLRPHLRIRAYNYTIG